MVNNKTELNPDILEFLNDPGAEIKPLGGITLGLEDIFVFPELQPVSHIGGSGSIIRSDNLVKLNSLPDVLLITGPENSGKTSLLKILMKGYSASGLYPIFLDMKQSGTIEYDRLWELLRSTFERQYDSSSLQRVITSQKEQKVCLIDNIPVSLFEKGFLSKLLENFGHIILFSESPLAADLLESLSEKSSTIASFNLVELRQTLREELCRKWHSANTQDINDRESRIKSSLKIIEEALSLRLAPSYPIIVLTILNRASSEDEYSPLDSTYASYIEHIIVKPLKEGPYSADIDNLKLNLSKIGYEMFTSKRSELGETELSSLLGEKADEVKSVLLSSGLLIQRSRGVGFKYEFSYSYFAAKYIAENLDREEIRQKVRELCQEFRGERSASILLFLTYLSEDPLIEDEIIRALKASHETAVPESIKERLEELDELIESTLGSSQKDKKLKEIRADYSSSKDIMPGSIIRTSYAREYKTPAQTERLIKHIEQIICDLALLKTSGEALRKRLSQKEHGTRGSELEDTIINFWLSSFSSAIEQIPLLKDIPSGDQDVYSSANSPAEGELGKISEYNLAIHIVTLYINNLSGIFGGENPADIISGQNYKLPEGKRELIDKCFKLLEKQNQVSRS